MYIQAYRPTGLLVELGQCVLLLFLQENKEVQEKRQKAMQERKAEMERLQREALEREVAKKRKELADLRRMQRDERIESLKKTAVGIRALETISAEVTGRGGGLSCMWYIYGSK